MALLSNYKSGGSGSVLQTVTHVQNIENSLTSTVITDTGITPLTLNRKDSTSKILMELTGGRLFGYSQGSLTYFYVSENSGAYTNVVTTGTSAVEYFYTNAVYDSGSSQFPHCARYVYTPQPVVTTVSLKVYFNTNSAIREWHIGNTEPLILTMTEIKG